MIKPFYNKAERNEIYNALIKKFSPRAQLIIAIEELSELQKELCKYLRGDAGIRKISEEMADVEIMLEQLKLIFENEHPISIEKNYKINRIKERYFNE